MITKFKIFEKTWIEEVDERWLKIPYKKRVQFLVDTFDLDEREVYEICGPESTIYDLPDELLDEIDEIRYFLMTPLEKDAEKYNL